MREALVRAYRTSPAITAQRANLRAIDETVPIARADGLPAFSITGGFTENVVKTNTSFVNPDRSLNGAAQFSVPIYQGGAVRSAVRAAETRVEAGRASLRSAEADLFTDVVGGYMDVIRDEAIVGLNTQNVRVLDVNLGASRDRFRAGDLTRTDVAQSEARLAIAQAQLQTAEARLIGSRETYIRLVGAPPGALDQPPALPHLPPSPEAAVASALRDNPTLQAAIRQSEATRYDVGVANAQRLPRLSAVVGGNYYNYLGSLGSGTAFSGAQNGTSASAGVQLTVPIFQGGRPGAQVRQAQALRSQAIEDAIAAERAVIAAARAAYASWRSSNEVIVSSETAVRANRLSLEGVRAENSVGTRTILDILNAEQELLNSQVTLVTARRDSYVVGFALLAAMGQAEARDLGLDVASADGVDAVRLYDPAVNFARVRHALDDYASDGEPDPAATRTNKTTAQDARVLRSLDAAVDTPVDRTPALTTGASAPGRQ